MLIQGGYLLRFEFLLFAGLFIFESELWLIMPKAA